MPQEPGHCGRVPSAPHLGPPLGSCLLPCIYPAPAEPPCPCQSLLFLYFQLWAWGNGYLQHFMAVRVAGSEPSDLPRWKPPCCVGPTADLRSCHPHPILAPSCPLPISSPGNMLIGHLGYTECSEPPSPSSPWSGCGPHGGLLGAMPYVLGTDPSSCSSCRDKMPASEHPPTPFTASLSAGLPSGGASSIC